MVSEFIASINNNEQNYYNIGDMFFLANTTQPDFIILGKGDPAFSEGYTPIYTLDDIAEDMPKMGEKYYIANYYTVATIDVGFNPNDYATKEDLGRAEVDIITSANQQANDIVTSLNDHIQDTYSTKLEVEKKQDKLTAGENIIIDDAHTIISADIKKPKTVNSDLITKEIKLQDITFEYTASELTAANIYITVLTSTTTISDNNIEKATVITYNLPEINQNDIITNEDTFLTTAESEANNSCLIVTRTIDQDTQLYYWDNKRTDVNIVAEAKIVIVLISNQALEETDELKNRYKDAIITYSYYDPSTAEIPNHEIDLYSNTEVHYTSPVTALKIGSFISSYPGYSESWTISFIAGDEDPIVDLPDNVRWAVAEPAFEANKYYLLTFIPVGTYYLGVWTMMEPIENEVITNES